MYTVGCINLKLHALHCNCMHVMRAHACTAASTENNGCAVIVKRGPAHVQHSLFIILFIYVIFVLKPHGLWSIYGKIVDIMANF